MVECLTGSVLNDRYRIVGEVGRGHTAAVFKAVDLTDNRSVAVKVLHEEVAADDAMSSRFRREAETASQLDHPNLVRVHDFGMSDDHFPFLVMDYVSGMLLGTLVSVEGRLALPKALPIFIQIADGMSYLHDHGIIHRDLRPDNVFLVSQDGKENIVKIVDFGVAKNLHETGQKKLTAEGEILGTPEYMSPEQIFDKNLDGRTDIYSMGCLMFNVLTGQLPFVGNTPVEILKHKMQSDGLDFSDPSRGRHLPKELQELVNTALSKDPNDRQQSMHEIKDALLALRK